MGLIIPFSIIYKLHSGLSVSQAILTESITLLAAAIADLPAGFIANVINNKRSLLIGALCHLVGMILLFIGGSLAIFIVSAVIFGLGWAFVSGADEAYLHDDYLEDSSMYQNKFSTVTIIDESFTIVGMVAASIAIRLHTELKTLFLLSSIILFIHLIFTAFVLPRSKAAITSSQQERFSKRITLGILRNKQIFVIMPLMLAFAVIYEAGRPLWQPHLQQLGINVANFGILFAIFKLASIVGSVFSRRNRFNARDLIYIFILMLASLLVFGMSFKVLSIVALCIYLFAENFFRVYISTVLNRAILTDRAAVLSFSSVIRNTSGALIVAGTGALASRSIFVAVVALVALKIPAILYIFRTRARF